MKKILVFCIGLMLCVGVINLQAQAVINSTGGTTVQATNTPISWYQPFLNVINDIGSASNIAVAPFGVALVSGDKSGTIGGGAMILYNVNNYVGVGIGTYWLGQWYEFNGSVQLQYPIALWSSVVVTPFVVGGVGTSLSGSGGANGDVVTVSQIGVNVDVVNIGKGWELGFGPFFGNISGAGAYSGDDIGGFAKLSRGF